MKTRLLIVLAAAALLGASCGSKNYVQEEGFCTALPDKDTVVFDYNRPVALFTSCGENLAARVTSVNDSRCPEGVNCVWAGRLAVGIELDGLQVTLEKDKVLDTFYRNNRYSFFLVNALPEPVAQNSVPAEQKKIYVKITRANRSRPVMPDNTLPVASDSTARPKS